jgi:hypothetical protein
MRLQNINFGLIISASPDHSDGTVLGVGLRHLTCWDCGFESHQGNGFLSLATVVFFQAEVSATGRSLMQGSHTDCIIECYQLQQ